MIGRMDAKAHRQHKIFEVKSLHLESDIRQSAAMFSDVNKKYGKWLHGMAATASGMAMMFRPGFNSLIFRVKPQRINEATITSPNDEYLSAQKTF
jgi:hypothetical protein